MSKRKHSSEAYESEADPPSEEPVPSLPGTYDGELSPGGQWLWRGIGAPDDKWVPTVADRERFLPEPTPLAASAAFYITVAMTYPPGATQIGQATTFQLITPWGQSTACMNLVDAFNQMVSAGSAYSGQMGNFLNNGVTRGLSTTSATVPTGATPFQALP